MSWKFFKQFKDGGSPFDANSYDIESTILFAAKGDKEQAEKIRENIVRGFYTEESPLETNASKLWSKEGSE